MLVYISISQKCTSLLQYVCWFHKYRNEDYIQYSVTEACYVPPTSSIMRGPVPSRRVTTGQMMERHRKWCIQNGGRGGTSGRGLTYVHFIFYTLKPFIIMTSLRIRTHKKVAGIDWVYAKKPKLKGTQDWDFFWLRFWNLYYFFISYVKISRFYHKKFLIRPLLGEIRFFRLVWD
jgi:hypothetical protein